MKVLGSTRDNERSWAIELITYINSSAKLKEDSIIKHASGEMSLSKGSGSLFPDVMLFGDSTKMEILQGWELKYPDTNINDIELFNNAKQKAELLGVNSFLLWNASIARLYVRYDENDTFVMLKEWDELSYIKSRTDVSYHMGEINELLAKIIDDLNYFFRNGTLKSERIISSITGELVIEFILKNIVECAKSLKDGAILDYSFNDEVALWWEVEKGSYVKNSDKWIELSKLAVISILNKIIFANILKKYNSEARIIDNLVDENSINDLLDVFSAITNSCDFYNIFEEKAGEKYIDEDTANILVRFNQHLVNLDFTCYDDELLGSLLSQIVVRSKRKITGQFSTPRELALFLIALTMKSKSDLLLDIITPSLIQFNGIKNAPIKRVHFS